MKLPGVVREAVERALGPIESEVVVDGGRARGAARVDLTGRTIFVKFDTEAPPDFYGVEAAGLEAMRQVATGFHVPAVFAVQDTPGGASWIAMEWLPPGRPSAGAGAGAQLGEGIALMHRASAPRWGWARDGYIGRLPQSNRWTEDWATFWWRERLEPQLRLAREAGHRLDGPWAELGSALPTLLRPADLDGPSLLHGDLWSGNALSLRDGPALIDPSCYFGHREVDLAMTELFGGFGAEFYAAYESSWPLGAGYPARRPVYQLYYLLVHINLFGESYVARTMTTLRTALSGQ